MSTQIAIRLPDDVVERLDAGVAAGRYPTRAAAIRAAVEALLRAEREREIAAEYRRAYGAAPQGNWIGDAGLAFMAQALDAMESSGAGDASEG